jgi:drug/metabolite transporter (DMT)-like permease
VGETIHWTTYAGLLIIIAGIVYQQWMHQRVERTGLS